jgi:hypothetical protein
MEQYVRVRSRYIYFFISSTDTFLFSVSSLSAFFSGFPFLNLMKFRYLKMTVNNRNLNDEDIRSSELSL